MPDLKFESVLQIDSETTNPVSERMPISLGGGYFALVWAGQTVVPGPINKISAALYKVSGSSIVLVQAEQTIFTAPANHTTRTHFAARLPFETYTPLPGGGAVAVVRMTANDNRQVLSCLLMVGSDSGLQVTVKDLYAETFVPDTSQRNAIDKTFSEVSVYSGSSTVAAPVAGGIMLVTQFNLYSGGVFTVAARTCDVTAAGFGAATLWAAVVPWWDENVSQSIYPLVGCAAGTGVVVYAQTKSPSFSAQDARVLWIDKNLTLGTNLVVPFKGDFNDSRMWPREGGGYALIAYHGATSLYHGLTFTGTGTDIALGQIEPFAIEGFQWLMTGPCRLLSGNLYASFEPYGTYTNFLPITYSTPIVEGAFFEVPEMNKSYTYSEALDDRRSLVVWARNWNSTTARYENFLALLQVEAVASGMVKGARAAFVRPY